MNKQNFSYIIFANFYKNFLPLLLFFGQLLCAWYSGLQHLCPSFHFCPLLQLFSCMCQLHHLWTEWIILLIVSFIMSFIMQLQLNVFQIFVVVSTSWMKNDEQWKMMPDLFQSINNSDTTFYFHMLATSQLMLEYLWEYYCKFGLAVMKRIHSKFPSTRKS